MAASGQAVSTQLTWFGVAFSDGHPTVAFAKGVISMANKMGKFVPYKRSNRDKALMPEVPKGNSKATRKAAAAQVATSVQAHRRNAAELNREGGKNPWSRSAAEDGRQGFAWSTTNGELTDWRNPDAILPKKAGGGDGPLEPRTKKTPPDPTRGARMGIRRGFDPVFLFCTDKRCQWVGAMAQPSGKCPGGHVIEPPKKAQP